MLLFSTLVTANMIVPNIIPYVMPLTIKNVVIILKEADVQHIDIVLRQIKLETEYLTSSLATERNNLFGFRTRQYMTFNTWQESIYYYKRWQDKKYKGENYYTFLTKVGYAEDSAYINKLKNITHKTHIKELIGSN